MDYKIVKQVLALEDLSSEQKLQLISDIADKFDKMEKMAEKSAIQENRPITMDDRYEAAAKLGVTFEINTDRLMEMIHAGAVFVVKQQTSSGGWGRDDRQRVPARIHNRISDDVLPLPSAWMTVMALSILQNYKMNFNDSESSVAAAIGQGLDWLVRNQNPDGSWNDVDRFVIDSPANVIQTGMALCGLISGVIYDSQPEQLIHGHILGGLDYLAKVQDKTTGGWPSLPGEEGSRPESKATSMAVFASLMSDKLLQLPTPIAKGLTQQAMQWLIDNQLPDGNWGYPRTPDSFLFGIYYSIEALMYYRMLCLETLEADDMHKEAVERSLRKALHWYTENNRLVRCENGIGWAWKNGDRSGDIANTAAAICILLDCVEDDFSFVIRKGVEFLMQEIDPISCWGDDTSLVVYSFMKYIKPEMRSCVYLKKYIQQKK